MKLTIASYITLIRIILTPCIVVAIVQQCWGIVLLLFLLAMLTDFFDGFVARRYQQESKLGALLDPVADKFLIISSMYALLCNISDSVIYFAMIFLIVKEFILLSGAAILHFGFDIFIKPNPLSRAASVAEMILIVLLAALSYTQIVIPLCILYGLVILFCGLSMTLLLRYSVFIWQLFKRIS